MAVIIDSTAQIDGVRFREAAGDPATPAASHWVLYTKAGGLYIIDDAGVVTGPFGTGGGGGAGPVLVTLTNQSGTGVVEGDVVQIDDSGTESFTVGGGSPDGMAYMLGVAQETIANGASGLVAIAGRVANINLDASASIMDRLSRSNTTKQAHPRAQTFGAGADIDEGVFGIALEAGTTPAAIIWPLPQQPAERMLDRASVNLNTATAVTLYTVPTTRSCVVTRIVLRGATVSLTTVSFSVGWNSTAFDNVIADATHTEITGSSLYTVIPAKNGATVGAASEVLKLKNNTLQGSPATATIEVFGYLY